MKRELKLGFDTTCITRPKPTPISEKFSKKGSKTFQPNPCHQYHHQPPHYHDQCNGNGYRLHHCKNSKNIAGKGLLDVCVNVIDDHPYHPFCKSG